MPTKDRYQKTVDGVKYDLSPKQFQLLATSTIKLPYPTPWADQRSVNGLENRGLVTRSSATSKTVTYKRTETGTKVYKALAGKEKK